MDDLCQQSVPLQIDLSMNGKYFNCVVIVSKEVLPIGVTSLHGKHNKSLVFISIYIKFVKALMGKGNILDRLD